MGENLWDPNGNKFNVIHFPLWFVHGLLQKFTFSEEKRAPAWEWKVMHTRVYMVAKPRSPNIRFGFYFL